MIGAGRPENWELEKIGDDDRQLLGGVIFLSCMYGVSYLGVGAVAIGFRLTAGRSRKSPVKDSGIFCCQLDGFFFFVRSLEVIARIDHNTFEQIPLL